MPKTDWGGRPRVLVDYRVGFDWSAVGPPVAGGFGNCNYEHCSRLDTKKYVATKTKKLNLLDPERVAARVQEERRLMKLERTLRVSYAPIEFRNGGTIES
jgi:hypothetical protein